MNLENIEMDANPFSIVDIEHWERKPLFDHFSKTRMPHYAVSAYIDVTRLLEYKRAHGLSFYLSLVYLVTESLNNIDEFHYRIIDGQVVWYSRIETNFTHKRPEERVFRFCTAPFEGSLEEYVAATSDMIARQTTLFGGMGDIANVAYCTCVPTLDLTASTNPGMDNPDDAIPRINWGKYVWREGRWMLNITVMANHRFIDGYHLGLFYNGLQTLIDQLG